MDHKEGWVPKNWCFWIMVLEKILESPLDCKEIKPVNPEVNQSWILFGRTDPEAENPILWPPDAKNRLIRKDPDAGKDWKQEEKGMTEDEMVGWHHWLNGHEFQQAPGDGKGQGGLACCSPWGCKELDTTEWMNNSPLVSLWPMVGGSLGDWEGEGGQGLLFSPPQPSPKCRLRPLSEDDVCRAFTVWSVLVNTLSLWQR